MGSKAVINPLSFFLMLYFYCVWLLVELEYFISGKKKKSEINLRG